jgi:hypothetical protein
LAYAEEATTRLRTAAKAATQQEAHGARTRHGLCGAPPPDAPVDARAINRRRGLGRSMRGGFLVTLVRKATAALEARRLDPENASAAAW